MSVVAPKYGGIPCSPFFPSFFFFFPFPFIFSPPPPLPRDHTPQQSCGRHGGGHLPICSFSFFFLSPSPFPFFPVIGLIEHREWRHDLFFLFFSPPFAENTLKAWYPHFFPFFFFHTHVGKKDSLFFLLLFLFLLSSFSRHPLSAARGKGIAPIPLPFFLFFRLLDPSYASIGGVGCTFPPFSPFPPWMTGSGAKTARQLGYIFFIYFFFLWMTIDGRAPFRPFFYFFSPLATLMDDGEGASGVTPCLIFPSPSPFFSRLRAFGRLNGKKKALFVLPSFFFFIPLGLYTR